MTEVSDIILRWMLESPKQKRFFKSKIREIEALSDGDREVLVLTLADQLERRLDDELFDVSARSDLVRMLVNFVLRDTDFQEVAEEYYWEAVENGWISEVDWSSDSRRSVRSGKPASRAVKGRSTTGKSSAGKTKGARR